MPPQTSSSSITGLNTAATARASVHPYAGTHANNRASRRTASVDEKVPISPSDLTETAETLPAQTSKTRKKNNAVTSQPKSTRQQFSACHACRYRRVKCDLKDLSGDAPPGEEISCTNCRDRGIRCKDDYAETKKQLRRGKRINQLELEDNILDHQDGVPTYQSPQRPRTTIPNLKPEFFDSPFYRRFHIQRPIIDPVEFRSRYVTWLQHHLSPESNASLSSATAPLSAEGQLLAKILVVWAAAYGVDEAGVEQPQNSYQDVQKRRLRVKSMIEEVTHFIDSLSLLRKPSWDGVRCLLMTLPLTEDVLDNPLDRLAMYEAAVQQVYTLCQHDGVATGASSEVRAANTMVRARIFWYAYVHEGLTTGLRGGRLLMDDDDLAMFQRDLPAAHLMGNPQSLTASNMKWSRAVQYATAPIRLASACRKVHAALTGPKARNARRLDGGKLEEAWEALALCWEEFESLRPIQRSDYVTNEDNDRFVDGWQIFLFECYNVIQEKIRDRLDAAKAARIDDGDPDSPATMETLIRDLNKYLQFAESKCFDVLEHVVGVIRRHLGSGFFAYDASLVRDGCFFAGHTLALMPGRDEDVKVCLQALSEMRWAFSKGYERSQSIRMVWRTRNDDGRIGQHTPSSREEDEWPSGETYGGSPPILIDTSRASPPIPVYTAPSRPPNVASLPTHAAPVASGSQLPPQRSHHATQSYDAPRQYHQHLADGSRHPQPARLDIGAATQPQGSSETSHHSAEPSPDRNFGHSFSPSHVKNPPNLAGASTHSSSSDGSSPPELAAQPIPHYQIASKSPTVYNHHTIHRGSSMDSNLPTTHSHPPVYTQGYTSHAPHRSIAEPPSQYLHYPAYHQHTGPQAHMNMPTTNGSAPQSYMYPTNGRLHPVTYDPNSHIIPEDVTPYIAGNDYGRQNQYIQLHVPPGEATGHPYPTQNRSYYAPQ